MNANNHWIEIFRPGRHVSMNGHAFEFSEAAVAATAQAYDTKLHSAPFVVGHPTTDAPAYGWARALAVIDRKLVAMPSDVDPAFAELVNAKRYAKISASFYPPDSAANPVPGVYYLRHVGFLGAQAPAVKGLKDPAFATAGDARAVITFEFGECFKGDFMNTAIAERARAYKAKMDNFGFSLSFGEAVDAVVADEDRIEFGAPAQGCGNDASIARSARVHKAEMEAKGVYLSYAEAVDAVTGRSA